MTLSLECLGVHLPCESVEVALVAPAGPCHCWVSTSRETVQHWYRESAEGLDRSSTGSESPVGVQNKDRSVWRIVAEFRAPGRVAFLVHLGKHGLLAQTADCKFLFVAGHWRSVKLPTWNERITAVTVVSGSLRSLADEPESRTSPTRFERTPQASTSSLHLLLGTAQGTLYSCLVPQFKMTAIWSTTTACSGAEPICGLRYLHAARTGSPGHELLILSTPTRLYYVMDPFSVSESARERLNLDRFMETAPCASAEATMTAAGMVESIPQNKIGSLFGDWNWLSRTGILHFQVNRSALAAGQLPVVWEKSWIDLSGIFSASKEPYAVFGAVDIEPGCVLLGIQSASAADGAVFPAQGERAVVSDDNEPSLVTSLQECSITEHAPTPSRNAAPEECFVEERDSGVRVLPSSERGHTRGRDSASEACTSDELHPNTRAYSALALESVTSSVDQLDRSLSAETAEISPGDCMNITHVERSSVLPSVRDSNAAFESETFAFTQTPAADPQLPEAVSADSSVSCAAFEHALPSTGTRTEQVLLDARSEAASTDVDPVLGFIALYSLVDGRLRARMAVRKEHGRPLALLPGGLLVTSRATYCCRVSGDVLKAVQEAFVERYRLAEALANCKTTEQKDVVFLQYAEKLLSELGGIHEAATEADLQAQRIRKQQIAFYLARCRSLQVQDALKRMIEHCAVDAEMVLAYVEQRVLVEEDTLSIGALESLQKALQDYRSGADAETFLSQPCVLRDQSATDAMYGRLYRLMKPGSTAQVQLREQILQRALVLPPIAERKHGSFSNNEHEAIKLLQWAAVLLAEQGNEADLFALIQKHAPAVHEDRSFSGFLLWLVNRYGLWHVHIELLLMLDKQVGSDAGYREDALDVAFEHAAEMALEASPLLERLLDRICGEDRALWRQALDRAPASCRTAVWSRALLERRVVTLGEALDDRSTTRTTSPVDCPLPAQALSHLFRDMEHSLAIEQAKIQDLISVLERLDRALEHQSAVRHAAEAVWRRQSTNCTESTPGRETPQTAWFPGHARSLLPDWMTRSLQADALYGAKAGASNAPAEMQARAALCRVRSRNRSLSSACVTGTTSEATQQPTDTSASVATREHDVTWFSPFWLESLNASYR